MQLNQTGSISVSSLPDCFYFFFPPEEEKKEWLSKKHGHRYIFEGEDSIDKFEISCLSSLESYIRSCTNNFQVEMPTPQVLRTLQENSFDVKKTIQKLGSNKRKWENFQPKRHTKEILSFLLKGLVYVHGFDNRFRPIVVIKLFSIYAETSSGEARVSLAYETLEYVLDYLVHNVFLPGQIENWVVLVDFGSKLIPTEFVSDFFNFFHTFYPSRTFRFYLMLLNPLLYKLPIINGAFCGISDHLIIKSDKRESQKMWEHVNPKQVELKYGGTARTLSEMYWPPQYVQGEVCQPRDKLLSLVVDRKTYAQMVHDKKLVLYKLHPDFTNDLEGEPDQEIFDPSRINSEEKEENEASFLKSQKASFHSNVLGMDPKEKMNHSVLSHKSGLNHSNVSANKKGPLFKSTQPLFDGRNEPENMLNASGYTSKSNNRNNVSTGKSRKDEDSLQMRQNLFGNEEEPTNQMMKPRALGTFGFAQSEIVPQKEKKMMSSQIGGSSMTKSRKFMASSLFKKNHVQGTSNSLNQSAYHSIGLGWGLGRVESERPKGVH